MIKRYKLEIIVFVSGSIVMILEIVGSRVLAPYLGSSIYTWTSLIGVIMGSLSIGYYYGGKLADRGASYKALSTIFFLSGCFVLLANLVKHLVLSILSMSFPDPKISALLAGSLLFSIPSILLGAVSPYAVKLGLDSLNKSGSTVGNLYAISTLGSIFGTFVSGFYLISFFGTTVIIYILAALLFTLSIFVYPKNVVGNKVLLILLCIFLALLKRDVFMLQLKNFIDIDTTYNRVWIYDDVDGESGRPVRRITLNRQNASAMFLDGEDLVFDYTKYFSLIWHFNPGIKNVLLIGGAAYSYPKAFIKEFPTGALDVVEIDPALEGLAKKYFMLPIDERLTNIPEDGRAFLNTTERKYDAILLDAFNSDISIPFHLTTLEAVQKIRDSLNDGGVLITNIISAIKGKYSRFYTYEFNTYKKIFPNVRAFKVGGDPQHKTQNIILIASKSDNELELSSENTLEKDMLGKAITEQVQDDHILLTDDYAPVESFFN